MPLFPSLPSTPHISDVFQAFPDNVNPLLEYHDLLLRGDSPLSVGQREMIAAYVSGLNACRFCFGAHRIYAEVFGVSGDLIDKLIEDLDSAPIEDEMRPILRYVQKLTALPARLTTSDAEAVYAQGWSEKALYDAIQVCALFNFMNRIVEGTGVSFDYAANPPTDDELEVRKSRSYSDFGKMIGL